MSTIHFLNVLEGDCNIIQHDSKRISVIDVSNAYNELDTDEEEKVRSSVERKQMLARTKVPVGKVDYRQKHTPDNPIAYLKNNIKTNSIFRFIITHPDMDHLDGIKDLFEEFSITNIWDTDNIKSIDLNNFFAGYNKEDWKFYTLIRKGAYTNSKRLTLYSGGSAQYWANDDIQILCPTNELVKKGNENSGDYHDLSYVLLYTPPKANGKKWKIIFAGDSHDSSWEYILKNYKDEVSSIDVLFAPHHGRDSKRDYKFLEVLKPKVTLFGNASSNHLAYDCYPPIRITNNQAGYIIIDISPTEMNFYIENYEFARDFKSKRNWNAPDYNSILKAYGLFKLNA